MQRLKIKRQAHTRTENRAIMNARPPTRRLPIAKQSGIVREGGYG